MKFVSVLFLCIVSLAGLNANSYNSHIIFPYIDRKDVGLVNGINNANTIVGMGYEEPLHVYHFVFSPRQGFVSLPIDHPEAQVLRINNLNQIVGVYNHHIPHWLLPTWLFCPTVNHLYLLEADGTFCNLGRPPEWKTNTDLVVCGLNDIGYHNPESLNFAR